MKIKNMNISLPSIIILIIGIGLIGFGIKTNFMSHSAEVTEISITNKFATIAELSTFEYGYTMIDTYEDAIKAFDLDIPFTTKKMVIVAEGKIKLGFNFDNVKPKIDNKNHKIYIKLPDVQVLDNYLEILKCIEDNNIFNPISTNDSQKLLEAEKKKRLKEAKEKGAFDEAEKQAKKVIQSMYSDIDGYEITVE